MASIGRNLLSEILSLLFPQRCVHCGQEGDILCGTCHGLLESMGERVCRRCGGVTGDGDSCLECSARQLHFGTARALFAYSGPARSVVHALKYGNQRRLARTMASFSSGSDNLTGFFQGATLVPVPMHHTREFERGYNQAALYARALAGRWSTGYAEPLIRVHETTPQNSLGFQGRLRNPRNSVELKQGVRLPAGRVVLVDDVYTTGSTASESARILVQGLGVEVDVWTFARTVKRWSRETDCPMGEQVFKTVGKE